MPESISDLYVYKVSKKWDPTYVSWYKASKNSAWEVQGGDTLTPVVLEKSVDTNMTDSLISLPVTSAIQEFVTYPDRNNGLLVFMGGFDHLEFRSSEYRGNMSQRPKLTVTFDDKTPLQPKKPLKTSDFTYRVSQHSNSLVLWSSYKGLKFVNLVNPSGIVIKNCTWTGTSCSVSTVHIPSGLFLVMIVGANGTYVSKIIIN